MWWCLYRYNIYKDYWSISLWLPRQNGYYHLRVCFRCVQAFENFPQRDDLLVGRWIATHQRPLLSPTVHFSVQPEGLVWLAAWVWGDAQASGIPTVNQSWAEHCLVQLWCHDPLHLQRKKSIADGLKLFRNELSGDHHSDGIEGCFCRYAYDRCETRITHWPESLMGVRLVTGDWTHCKIATKQYSKDPARNLNP